MPPQDDLALAARRKGRLKFLIQSVEPELIGFCVGSVPGGIPGVFFRKGGGDGIDDLQVQGKIQP